MYAPGRPRGLSGALYCVQKQKGGVDMIFFIWEGRYVTTANQFCFRMPFLRGAGGTAMSCTLLGKADQLPVYP